MAVRMEQSLRGVLYIPPECVGIMWRGDSKAVACPVCFMPEGEKCVDRQGKVQTPVHVDRARQSRWKSLGMEGS